MEQQLTIFDELSMPIEETFAIGDTVEVVANMDESQVEDYYYLQDHAGLQGQIVKLLSRMQFEVQFPKRERLGIFGQDELRRI